MKPANTKIFPSDYSKIQELSTSCTLQEIGDMYGVSRERIRQILKAEFNTTVKPRDIHYICSVCGREFMRHIKFKSTPLCDSCRHYRREHGADLVEGNPRRRFQIGPCSICHKKRGNISGLCSTCYAREQYRSGPKRREASKKWAQAHPERVRQYSLHWIDRNPEKARISRKKSYNKHKEQRREKQKIYYARNREYIREYVKQRYIKRNL